MDAGFPPKRSCGTGMDRFLDGTWVVLEHTDTVLSVHSPDVCAGRPCTVHSPTSHGMRGFPQLWRSDKGHMERVCPHGVGHPDPDERHSPTWRDAWSVHGCDGCCAGAYVPVTETEPVEDPSTGGVSGGVR